MRTSIIALTGKVTLAALLATATPSFAQEAEEESSSDFTVSGNATVASDYRFRGVSFSDGDVAIQGGIDVNHSSGFYVGVWGSSQDEGQNSIGVDDGTGAIINVDSGDLGNVEIDVYGGWAGEVGGGLNLDVGLLYFYFPDATQSVFNTAPGGVGGAPILVPGSTETPSDFFEPYITLSKTFGPLEANIGANYAWSQSALGDNDSIYIHGGVSTGIPSTPITLNANIGYTDGSLDVSGSGSYVDWLIGAEYAVTSNLTFGVAYTDTDAPSINDSTDGAIVFTLGVSF